MVADAFGILGRTLAGTFLIEEVIAEGGFGVVYRAEHTAFRAPVALKCLKIPEAVSGHKRDHFVERFREEAEILFHLSASIPEVVRPLHVDALTTDHGILVPFIAMEWVDGDPLDAIVLQRETDGLPPLPLDEVVPMLTPIAHALAKAHRFRVPGGSVVSVTHCDLKPENILITREDSTVGAKILDFGIAKARDLMRQSAGRISDSEDANPFTPSYGAPEQWVPKRYGQSGPWTDVWGLALTMVECLTGKAGIDGDMHAMMGTALDPVRRPTPGREGADISEAAEFVFEEALAVDPRHRFKDIETFWTALETAMGRASSFLSGHANSSTGNRVLDRSSVSAPSKPLPSSGRRDSSEVAPPIDAPSFDLDLAAPPPPARSSHRASAAVSSHRASAAVSSHRASMEVNSARSTANPSRPSGPPASSLDARSLAQAGRTNELYEWRNRLKKPALLIAAGVALTVLDMVVASAFGRSIALGPIRLRWVAVLCASIGIITAFLSFAIDREKR